MKKVITLFSCVMLLIIGLPNAVAQNNQGQQDLIENMVDETTYIAVKEKCKAIDKLLDLTDREFDAVFEIMLHVEVKTSAILNNGLEDNQEKLLAGVKSFELESLDHVFNDRQLIRYQEWLVWLENN